MKYSRVLVAITALCFDSVIPMSAEYDLVSEDLETQIKSKNISKKPNDEFYDNIFETNPNNNEYWLFTRKNPMIPQIISDGNIISILNSNYDASKPLKVIAHGWTAHGQTTSSTMVTSAFLETSDVNVIVLDWSIAASGDYLSASSRVPATGRALGQFLQWLISNGGGDWNSVHLIGYSLGAHLMGNAGRVLGGRPKRVTGLDPAGPLWSANTFAINTQAGQYVEIIHTNIFFRGITEPIGHTDFYPNGGTFQPGCYNDHPCSHARSYRFFASSVRTDHFIARRCSNLLQAIQNTCYGSAFNMGNGILNKNGRGIYALSTGSVWPF